MIQKLVEKKDRLSCFTGVPIDHDRIVILLTADKLVKEEKPHVFICYWNGDVLINDNQTWTTVNTVQNRLTSEILVLGGEGEVYTGSFGEIKEETVIDIEPGEGKTGLLRNATPLGKGFLIVGMGGQVYLRKEDKTWTEIQHDYHNDYFWSLAWFQDTLYVVNNFLLLRYDGHTLVPVEFGEDIPFTFSRLVAAKDALWSFGPKDIMTFDGKRWKRVV